MKISGERFENSSTCHGVGYAVNDAPLDIAEITIDGRYPESGWARNRLCHEMVRVLRGSGVLHMRDGTATHLELSSVVHVPPGEWFAWNGDMDIMMACSPPFSPEQYELELEEGK